LQPIEKEDVEINTWHQNITLFLFLYYLLLRVKPYLIN
jgi:hypothetical protein